VCVSPPAACASILAVRREATPDIRALFASASYAPGPSRRLDDKPGMTSGIWQMRPLSRGHVEAKSPRPEDQPSINPRYLDDNETAAR
jgi:choline dehydrogenase